MEKNLNSKIFVAGHRGMVGSAIVRHLNRLGYTNIITKGHEHLDLTNQQATKNFFESERPDQVYLAAAMVGGIQANNMYPADFIYNNLMIEANVIHQSWSFGVKKLLFIGSSCAYPILSNQPIKEETLLTGKLELTSEPYAISKIAGIKLCESYNRQYGDTDGIDYRSIVPATLYGPGDNYHKENSHVIPALIRKFDESKIKMLPSVTIWGSGKPLREFLFVDDMAKALISIMNMDHKVFNLETERQCSHMNIGSGTEITISELANTISKIIGFNGRINYDKSKPDGAQRKFLDNTKISKIFTSELTSLDQGIQIAYEDYKNRYASF